MAVSPLGPYRLPVISRSHIQEVRMPKVQGVTIGAPVWLDLSTSDLDKATAFYTGLFGWNVLNTGPDFGSYHIASKGEAGVGGFMQKTEDEQASGVPDAWMMYFAVEDAKATA